eukprot:GILK01002314.1.p1 GENE.GILK01002314.1~~GILK01002314.1.p1  ORF type:complete len:312 (+),score=62.27 GILK01002314.1:43-936(+)
MSEAIGMMEGAFFVGRGELLSWINTFFKLNLTKVEQVASGAVHCQIMDAIFPGKVPMHKVNWKAKHEYEFVKNYKILQDVFTKCNIGKHIEVEKLVKAKYQDNLEFLQWMKRYFDLHYAGGEYDAVERRKGENIPEGGAPARASSVPKPAAAATREPSRVSKVAPVKKSAEAENVPPAGNTAPVRKAAAVKSTAAAHDGELSSKLHDLQQQNTELKLTVDGLEKERDFYFGKLRDIEILCQTHPDQSMELIQTIQKILYATEEDFVQVDAEGNPIDGAAAAETTGTLEDIGSPLVAM